MLILYAAGCEILQLHRWVIWMFTSSYCSFQLWRLSCCFQPPSSSSVLALHRLHQRGSHSPSPTKRRMTKVNATSSKFSRKLNLRLPRRKLLRPCHPLRQILRANDVRGCRLVHCLEWAWIWLVRPGTLRMTGQNDFLQLWEQRLEFWCFRPLIWSQPMRTNIRFRWNHCPF